MFLIIFKKMIGIFFNMIHEESTLLYFNLLKMSNLKNNFIAKNMTFHFLNII